MVSTRNSLSFIKMQGIFFNLINVYVFLNKHRFAVIVFAFIETYLNFERLSISLGFWVFLIALLFCTVLYLVSKTVNRFNKCYKTKCFHLKFRRLNVICSNLKSCEVTEYGDIEHEVTVKEVFVPYLFLFMIKIKYVVEISFGS